MRWLAALIFIMGIGHMLWWSTIIAANPIHHGLGIIGMMLGIFLNQGETKWTTTSSG